MELTHSTTPHQLKVADYTNAREHIAEYHTTLEQACFTVHTRTAELDVQKQRVKMKTQDIEQQDTLTTSTKDKFDKLKKTSVQTQEKVKEKEVHLKKKKIEVDKHKETSTTLKDHRNQLNGALKDFS